MARGFAVPLFAVLLLAACATPETRLRTGLMGAGLSGNLARCMADEMMPRLSVTQLLRLRDLSRAADRDPTKTGIQRYLHQVRALGDGAIWAIASRAAAGCTIGA